MRKAPSVLAVAAIFGTGVVVGGFAVHQWQKHELRDAQVRSTERLLTMSNLLTEREAEIARLKGETP